MHENRSEGLLVRVEPLQRAKEVCEMMVEGVEVIEGALEPDIDPAYAGAIETVLAEKGMRVSQLCASTRTLTSPGCSRRCGSSR